MGRLNNILAGSLLLLFAGCSSNYHTVKKNETLYSISVKNKVSVPDLMHMNNLSSPKIFKGQKLKVKGAVENTTRPTYHVVKSGETLYRLSVKYGLSVDSLKRYNGLSNNNIQTGQKIYLSHGLAPATKKNRANKTPVSPVLSAFRRPLKEIYVNSRYGSRVHPISGRIAAHHGVDLKASMNTPVYAPASGVVTYSGWMRGYGKIIIIDHGKGYTTRYAHLNRWIVGKGRKVKKGQLIAKTGNTGISTGPHLHYEIRKDGRSIDPISTL